MKRITLFTAACAFALTATIHADATRTAMAEELMGLMKIKQTMDKSFEAMKQMIPMQLQQMGIAPADAAKREGAMKLTMEIMAEEMSWDKIKGDMTAVYAEILNEEELKGLIEFYGSPVGQQFVDKQPQLVMRSMQVTQGRMMTVMPMIKTRVEELMAQ